VSCLDAADNDGKLYAVRWNAKSLNDFRKEQRKAGQQRKGCEAAFACQQKANRCAYYKPTESERSG
jgi:hypothetical protein